MKTADEIEALVEAAEEPKPENDCYDQRGGEDSGWPSHWDHGCSIAKWRHRTREARLELMQVFTPSRAGVYAKLLRTANAVNRLRSKCGFVTKCVHKQEWVDLVEAIAAHNELEEAGG